MLLTLSSSLVMILGYLLDRITNWLAENEISLITDKMVYMTLGNYSDSVPEAIVIEIHKQRIETVKSHKF